MPPFRAFWGFSWRGGSQLWLSVLCWSFSNLRKVNLVSLQNNEWSRRDKEIPLDFVLRGTWWPIRFCTLQGVRFVRFVPGESLDRPEKRTMTVCMKMSRTAGEHTDHEARNDYTNNSEAILLCNRCVCNRRIISQIINVCNWHEHSNHIMEAPELHKIIPARKPGVTDVPCNCEDNSQTMNMCVIIFGPIIANNFRTCFSCLVAAFVWQPCPTHTRYSTRLGAQALGQVDWQGFGFSWTNQKQFAHNVWELLDPTVADPVAQDSNKTNNIQTWATPHQMAQEICWKRQEIRETREWQRGSITKNATGFGAFLGTWWFFLGGF